MLGHSTAQRETLEVELRRSEHRFSALVTSSSDIALVVGSDGVLTYASPAFEAVLGYPSGVSEGLLGEQLIYPDDRETLRAAMAVAGGSGSPVHEEIRLQRVDGEVRWFEAAITNLTADPAVEGFVANLRDITRRKDAEDRLSHAALHDPLTGLPNRALIHNRAEQMLARARRGIRSRSGPRGTPGAIDRQCAPIRNLREVAGRLGPQIRRRDAEFAGRPRAPGARPPHACERHRRLIFSAAPARRRDAVL